MEHYSRDTEGTSMVMGGRDGEGKLDGTPDVVSRGGVGRQSAEDRRKEWLIKQGDILSKVFYFYLCCISSLFPFPSSLFPFLSSLFPFSLALQENPGTG